MGKMDELKKWETKIDYKIIDISKKLSELHDKILIRETVNFCNEYKILDYEISIDMLKEDLDLYIQKKENEKFGKDNNVTTKKTNREMLANMDNFQLAHFIVEEVMNDCVQPICCCTYGSEECERLNTCVVGIMKWLESEVEE